MVFGQGKSPEHLVEIVDRLYRRSGVVLATRVSDEGRASLAARFPGATVHDRARMELSKKVQVVHDPAITALGAKFRHKVRVDVHLRDGSVHSETREAPRGSEHSFAPAADIVAKFHKLARAVLPPTQREALVEAVLGLEKLADSRALVHLLGADARNDQVRK